MAKGMALLQGCHPTQTLTPRFGGWKVWISTQNHNVQRDAVQEKLNRYLPESWIAKKYESKGVLSLIKLKHPHDPNHPVNGTTIGFKTYDGGVQSYESASLDLIINDEEPPEDIYDAEQARVLDRRAVGNGIILCAMSPTEGMTWTHDRIVQHKDPELFFANISTYENPYLGRKEIEKMEAKLSPWQRKARIYGQHVAREGMVLEKFRPYNMPHGNIIPMDTFKQFYCDKNGKLDFQAITPYESIDYGYRYPTAVGFYGVGKDGEIIKYDEIYIAGWTVQQVKMAIYLKRLLWGYKEPVWTVIDPSTRRQESNGNTVFGQYARALDPDDRPEVFIPKDTRADIYSVDPENDDGERIAFSVPCIIADNSRDEGWELFNKKLDFDADGRAGFYFVDTCFNSIREARMLAWAPEVKGAARATQKEIARKRDDHTCDEGRYLVMSNPFYNGDYKGSWDTDDVTPEEHYNATTGY